MKIRYIADMHFDHADIIPYDNRPFDSVEEMNETLAANWNSVVSDEDMTWIVGDFCAGDAGRWKELLSGLKGRKGLILGNHDPAQSARAASDFLEEICEYKEIEDEGRKVVLCHYPIMSFHDMYFGSVHLYGHVHMSYDWNIVRNARRLMRALYVREDVMRMTNIGAMLPYMDYTPRTLDELLPQL